MTMQRRLPAPIATYNFLSVLANPYRSLSSTVMLRRKLSAGLLRAATATPTAASALPTAASGAGQSANLASVVLLSSGRSWKNETVTTIKSELKRRGLSQTGTK